MVRIHAEVRIRSLAERQDKMSVPVSGRRELCHGGSSAVDSDIAVLGLGSGNRGQGSVGTSGGSRTFARSGGLGSLCIAM